MGAPLTRLDLTDAMCVNCTPDDASFISQAATRGVVRNALTLASNSVAIGFGNLVQQNITVIGALETELSGPFIGGGELESCMVRESGVVSGAGSNRFLRTASPGGQGQEQDFSVEKCWFRDTRSSGITGAFLCNTNMDADHHCRFWDNAVVNHHRTSEALNALFQVRSFFGVGAHTISVRNNIFAYTEDQDEPGEMAPDGTASVGAEAGLFFDLGRADGDDSLEIGGNLFAGFRRAGAAYTHYGGALDRPDYAPEGWCFFGNQKDLGSRIFAPEVIIDTLEAQSDGVVRDEAGALVDPAQGDFRPRPGSAAAQVGCGPLQPVGVCEPLWYHAINRLEPECLASACANGVDDDGDGLVDLEDPACDTPEGSSERSSRLVCDDGLDNDGDGLVDFPGDPGCFHPASNQEAPACDNGIDDDGDGLVDLEDSDCFAAWDNAEARSRCGLGAELVILLPLLLPLRRLRRRLASPQLLHA